MDATDDRQSWLDKVKVRLGLAAPPPPPPPPGGYENQPGFGAQVPTLGYRPESGEFAFRGEDDKPVWMSPESIAAATRSGALSPTGILRNPRPAPQPPEVAGTPPGPAGMAAQTLMGAALQPTAPRPAAPRKPAPTVAEAAPVAAHRTYESLAGIQPSPPAPSTAVGQTPDDGFFAAEGASNKARLLAGLARAAQNRQGPNPAMDAVAQMAEAPMANYQAEVKHAADVRARAQLASDSDPASEQSAMARKVVGEVIPGLKNVPGFEKLSYHRLMTDPMFEKYAGLVEKQAASARAAGEKDAKDKAEEQHRKEMEQQGRDRIGIERDRLGIERQRASGAGGGAGGLSKQDEAAFLKMKDDLSTIKARNVQGGRQEILDRAEKLEALIGGTNLDKATPQQVREAATSLAAIIGKNSSAVSQIEELVPHTLAGQWANFKQRIMNEPQSAEARAFLENMLDTAAREKKVVQGQIGRSQAAALPVYAHLREKDPARWNAMVRSAGLDPDAVGPDGTYREATPALAGGGKKIKVTNGKETLMIDPADETDAAKDGYHRAP